MTPQPRGPQPIPGAVREIDITPVGWAPPSPEETLPILKALFHVPGPNGDPAPAGVFAGIAAGYELTGEWFRVKLIVFAEQPWSDVLERAKRARALVFAIRQQQRLRALSEATEEEQGKARRDVVDRAGRAMQAVGSAFLVEHPKAHHSDSHAAGIAREAPDRTSKTPDIEWCECGHRRVAHKSATELLPESCMGGKDRVCGCAAFVPLEVPRARN
jgi:hypothetical protein